MPAALLLAGAENSGPLKELSQARNEALIEINGKPMISFIIDTLQRIPDIHRILIVGPKLELGIIYPELEIIENHGSIIDNLSRGLEALRDEEFILILTSDIPMITEKAIIDFLERCQQSDGDFYYPVNSKEVSERAYPGVKRTYVRVKEGVFTGGNIFLVRTEAAILSLPKTKEFIAMRKKPLKLVAMLGITFVLRFITKTLTIRAAEERVSKILGLRGKAVISPYAEIGVDVDKPEDLMLAQEALKEAL
jgi:GTP:adenosylcobinamide-phosphate guanylyltransferase